MPNFCPSCGTKVEEGYKFCLSCGAQLQNTDTPPSNIPNSQEPPATQQQPLEQSGITPAMQPKKSNKILLISIIAIIAIIIIAVVVFIFLNRGVIDNRFVGEWEISTGGVDVLNWIFNSDGTLTMTVTDFNMDIATWSVKSNQLCLNMVENEIWGDFLPEGYEDEICYDFVFSNGDNTVSLSVEGSENFVLTKK